MHTTCVLEGSQGVAGVEIGLGGTEGRGGSAARRSQVVGAFGDLRLSLLAFRTHST